jgi:hypothetical protein
LFVDLIWRNLLYLPVERETLFRLSLASAETIIPFSLRQHCHAIAP